MKQISKYDEKQTGFSAQSSMDPKIPELRVMYAFPGAGLKKHQELAEKYLVPGAIYHVDHTEIQPWKTDVMLQEFPGVKFNSVLFAHPVKIILHADHPVARRLDVAYLPEMLEMVPRHIEQLTEDVGYENIVLEEHWPCVREQS